jgi:hypothetical protein
MKPRSGPKSKRALSRRRFLALLGSAAAATPVSAAIASAATTPQRRARPAAARTARVEAEIEKQKKFVSDALATIRAFPLPPGSDMAFVFAPLKPRRPRRT